MKLDKKLMAAFVAAAVCMTGSLIADDKEKVKEPAGAEAPVETSETVIEESETIVEEPAGAETDKPDQKFLKKAAVSGGMEVKMGELAAQKADSSSVKQFGDRLAKDHRQTNEKIKKLAEAKGVTVSEEGKGKVEEKSEKVMEHLAGLSGEEFDQTFIKHAVEKHERDVREFEKQAREGEDPAIRSFASETVPTLREHLRIAKMLQEDRNASIPALQEPAGAQPEAEKEPQAEPPKIEEQPNDAAGTAPPAPDANSQTP